MFLEWISDTAVPLYFNMTIEDLAGKASEEDLKQMYALISNSEDDFNYLEWSKERENVKASTYHSKKNARTSKPKEFLKKLKKEIEILREHTVALISQYRRIREVKELVSDPSKFE